MSHVLKIYFDAKNASDLVLRPVTIDISALVIDYGTHRAPFTGRLHTFIQAVSEVGDEFTLWLGSPFRIQLSNEKQRIGAELRCNKIQCDLRRGKSLIFEGQNEAGLPRVVRNSLGFTVLVDMERTLNPH